jgi:hypothetical protein
LISTLQNPLITFTNPGLYDVTLAVTNSTGTTSLIKHGNIAVTSGVVAACSLTSANNNNNYGIGATKVSLNSISNVTSTFIPTNAVNDFSCSNNTSVLVGNSYPLTVNYKSRAGGTAYLEVWIDWNNDGIFETLNSLGLNERVLTNNIPASSTGSPTVSIIPPANAVLNTILRMRVVTDHTRSPTVCGAGFVQRADDYGVFVKIPITIWNAITWSNGTPTASIDAIIDGTYSTTTNGVFTAKTLTVNANKSFTINSGKNITVAGAITNNGTFNVANNANLVQTNATPVTNTGNIFVNRNSASINLYDYTLWSSPVAGQKLKAFSPDTLNARFYFYNSGTNQYNVVPTPATTDFATANGYLIRAPNTWVASDPAAPFSGVFTGIPNNGNLTLSASALASDKFYAVGNPYPSTISADSFLNGNTTGGTLYFWRKTNNATATTTTSYATYTLAGGVGTANLNGGSSIIPNGTIQVGQGFIVKTGPSATELNFTNSMRTANTADQFLRTTSEKSRYWLNLTSTTGAFCQAMVAYMPEATSGVDNAIDGRYFNDSPIALTSIINSEEYTIQGRALPFSTTDTVPLGFKTNAAGNYTIAIDHVDGLFSTGQTVFLKDNLLNTVVDLSAGSYSFASAIGTFNSRFEVVYQSTLAVTNPTFTANSVIAFSANGEIKINSGSTIMELVRVYDLQGRLLAEKKQINASETTITTTASNQVLLVEITAANGSKITKKIIQ